MAILLRPAYILLTRQLGSTSVRGRVGVELTTIGESCRELLRGSIRMMISWVVDQLELARPMAETSKNGTKRFCAVYPAFDPAITRRIVPDCH